MRIVHLLSVMGAGLLFAAPAHPQAARTYDCAKAGNANKTVCKQAAAAKQAAPAATATKTTTKTRTYNCTLAGNANKTACKSTPTTATMAPAAPSAPTARTTSASRSTSMHTVSTSTISNAAGPNGATAICNDGTYSHSAHHSGTCSGHKGVKQFY